MDFPVVFFDNGERPHKLQQRIQDALDKAKSESAANGAAKTSSGATASQPQATATQQPTTPALVRPGFMSRASFSFGWMSGASSGSSSRDQSRYAPSIPRVT